MQKFAASLPPVSQEFFNMLTEAFPAITAEPNVTTMDEIMFNAGQRAVIEWIRIKAVRNSSLTGAADVTVSVDVRKS